MAAQPPADVAVPVERITARAFTIPTDGPESDGTLAWDDTTIVVVEAHGGGQVGLGYTYEHQSAADLVETTLADVVCGLDVRTPRRSWQAMVDAVRNIGMGGVAACAVSAVDVALWDLAAREVGRPVVDLLGAVRRDVPVYGSGGFCTYGPDRVAEQLGGWVDAGLGQVKMKVARHPAEDPARLDAARAAIGDAELFVDANGALTRKDALDWAQRYRHEWDVRWLEEPVSSDDLEGLRLLRDRGPGGLDIAAGEYGYHLPYFHHMLAAGAVDCLQADVTRCGGFTGFAQVAALCDARGIDLSAHCAPQLAAHACAAVRHLRHLEYFHDHVRIEHRLLDGVLEPVGGALRPDRDRPGLGLRLKVADAAPFAV